MARRGGEPDSEGRVTISYPKLSGPPDQVFSLAEAARVIALELGHEPWTWVVGRDVIVSCFNQLVTRSWKWVEDMTPEEKTAMAAHDPRKFKIGQLATSVVYQLPENLAVLLDKTGNPIAGFVLA